MDANGRELEKSPRTDGYRYPAGRRFMTAPRVMRCANDREGIVFAHGADNPWAQPRAFFEMWKNHPLDKRLIRLYGLALREMSARFGRFTRKVHVVPDSAIPKVGTNYQLMDPHTGRNFAMMWVRCMKGTDHYIYREWPGTMSGLDFDARNRVRALPGEAAWKIPKIGDPGAWTENDAKKQDGKAGPAQRKFNFGLLDYKFEIARLEGWKDYFDAKAKNFDLKDKECKPVSLWSARNGAQEEIFERIVDSRAASSPKMENDRPTSLQTNLLDVGLDFTLAKGEDVTAADSTIETLLSFDAEKPVDYFNAPHLFVAESCVNTIYMFENYTGLKSDNRTTDFDSACKEWSDMLRYYLLAVPVDVPKAARRAKPGVYF